MKKISTQAAVILRMKAVDSDGYEIIKVNARLTLNKNK